MMFFGGVQVLPAAFCKQKAGALGMHFAMQVTVNVRM
jgi:hypothetical protein